MGLLGGGHALLEFLGLGRAVLVKRRVAQTGRQLGLLLLERRDAGGQLRELALLLVRQLAGCGG